MLKRIVRIAVLFSLAMAAGAAFAASTPVTLSGIVADSQLTPVPSARLVWTVMNCATAPQVDGSDIASPFLVTANSSGVLSGTIHGSPDISCGATAYYQVIAYTNAGVQLWTRNYSTSGTTFNISSAPQLSSLPAPPTSGSGAQGAAGTIAIGTVSSLPAGSTPTVTNQGTSSAALLNFGIPKGDPGTFPGSSQFTGVQGSGVNVAAAAGLFTQDNLRSTDSSGSEHDSGIAVSKLVRTDAANTITQPQTEVSTNDSATPGSELLTGTGWTMTGTWTGSFASGFTSAMGNTGTVTYPIATVVGTYYLVTFTIIDPTPTMNSTLCVAVGGSTGAPNSGCVRGVTTPTVQTLGFKAVNTSSGLVISQTVIFGGSISSISLKAVSTLKAAQFTEKDTSLNTVYEDRYGPGTSGNIFQGYQSGQLASSIVNSDTATGYQALANEAIGSNNTAFGYKALAQSWGGSSSVGIGDNALSGQTTGFANTSVGSSALPNCTACQDVTVLGYRAGQSIITAGGNVLLGAWAGSNLTFGSSNILIGSFANGSTTDIDAPTPNTSNYMNLGNGLTAQNINRIGFGGEFGIGKQLANYSLDVNGTIRSTGLTDFSGSPAVTPTITGSTTYSYSVEAYLEDGTHTNPSAIKTITNGASTLSATSFNTISWTAVPGAAYYQVLQTSPVGKLIADPISSSTLIFSTSFKDTGIYITGSLSSGNNSWGLILGSSQVLTGVEGLGADILTTSGSLTTGKPITVDTNGTAISISTGLSGTCASTTTLTVVDGLITGCS